MGISKKSQENVINILLVQNIATQTESPDEVIEWVNDVRQSLEAAFEEISEGKAQ